MSVGLLNFTSHTQKSRGAESLNETGHLGFKGADVSASLERILRRLGSSGSELEFVVGFVNTIGKFGELHE
jgi:hypothetical protein